MEQEYLESVRKQFEYYKLLAEKAFEQVEEEDLFWQYNEESNSIAVIVNHLHGNMKSRWTDFLTSDGEKEWRDRDSEFEQVIKTKTELEAKWNEGWKIFFEALASVNNDNFGTIIYIRNQGHTVIEALNRQLAHYSYHVGQIVYIGRMKKGKVWKSLSIPKNESKSFNQLKFSKEKRKEHFTEEYLTKSEKNSDQSAK